MSIASRKRAFIARTGIATACVFGALSPAHAEPNAVAPVDAPPGDASPVDAPPGGAAAPASSSARRHQVGLGLSVEPALLTELYYSRYDAGIMGVEGQSWVRGGVAPLTGPTGLRLEFERWETLAAAGVHRLKAVGGLRVSGGRDAGARYTTLGATLGARYGYHFDNSALGLQALYVPALVTWLRFSDVQRQTFDDRYPDAREGAGPETATLGLASHRVVTALTYESRSEAWSLWLAAGLQFSPGAGREWATLELGQVPAYLRVLVGYRF